MSQEIAVAFVGAGGNAQGHMGRLAEIEGVSISAVCDLDADRAASVADQYGAADYTDYRRMLDEARAEAVYVAVPPFAHEDAEVLAARRGCHLFVEKPVVLHMDKGLEILEEIDRAGVLSCVGYQLRMLDATQRARRYLATRTVAMVSGHRWAGLPGTPWWRVMSQSGGQLHEQTTHQVDLMRYLAGEIVEVYAHYSRRVLDDVEGLDIPDSQGALFKFLDGTIGMVATSPMMSQGGGVSELRFLVGDHVLTWNTTGNSLDPDDDAEVTAEPQDTPSIDAAFVEAIRSGNGGAIPCSYRSGLQTSAVTLAANESARTERPVQVPLV